MQPMFQIVQKTSCFQITRKKYCNVENLCKIPTIEDGKKFTKNANLCQNTKTTKRHEITFSKYCSFDSRGDTINPKLA